MKTKKSMSTDKEPGKGINPYKGLYSYEETDKDVFYGREEEKESLFQLVRFNLLSVVFGKAGIGKTSLLNAGVFPLLREEGFMPVRVRLNYSHEAPPLPEQIRLELLKEIEKNNIRINVKNSAGPAEPMAPAETLWEYFHRVSHFDPSKGAVVIPVLLLDQFEELFTLGKDHKEREALTDELYWLIENQFPAPVKERMLKGEKRQKGFSFSTAKPDMRVIFTLREDYLPHLNGLKPRIASIGRAMFRVLHLNGKQARKIIGMSDRFREEGVIKDILHSFYPEGTEDGKIIPDEKLEIEPVFLSLLCQRLFEKRVFKSVTKEDRHKVLEDFYDTETGAFPAEVKEFIEEKLLTEGGFRTPFYLEPGLRLRKNIDRLVERRILRRFHDGDKEYIEVIHDVLAPIIKEKRNKRLEEIRKQEIRKEFELKKRIYRRTILVMSILGIVLALFAWYAFDQKSRADEQYNKAESLRLAAESFLELPKDKTRAIRIAEAAYESGLPHPPSRAYQALAAAGYSVFKEPFYIADLRHKGPVNSAVFSPDGTRILTASDDKTAKLWDNQGKLLADLKKHKGPVYRAVFSLDGTRILTASWDKTAKLWDSKGKLLADLKKHKNGVNTAVFSPDGTRILTASADHTAKLWDSKGKLLADLKKHKGPVYRAHTDSHRFR
jgi:hypothetical protein